VKGKVVLIRRKARSWENGEGEDGKESLLEAKLGPLESAAVSPVNLKILQRGRGKKGTADGDISRGISDENSRTTD